jgi:uncharacterized protein (DUF58 family)
MVTPRFFGLALGIPALFLLAGLIPGFVPLALIYGLTLLWLLWFDRRFAGSLNQFHIVRIHDEKLSLGAQNRIVLRVRSRARQAVEIVLRDEPPLLFAGALEAFCRATLQPGETIDLDYVVRPVKRGNFRFGQINVRWHGPLHFFIRQGVIPAAVSVKVYPDLHEIRKYDLLARRDELARMGVQNVRLRGEGTTFESLRDYLPDDPYSSINWKATARRGKPITMEYEPERSQRVLIALDVGRTMRSSVRVNETDGLSWNMAKVDFVLNSVLLFSYVATLKGDQVGLLIFADQVQAYIAPERGRAHFQKLLNVMYALESQPVEADYGRALAYLHTQNKKRSLTVLFTDVSGARAAEALIAHIPRLMPRHLPLVVTIRDPVLDEVASRRPDHSDAVYQRAVAEQLIDERRLLLENLQRRGVLTLDVAAEHLTMSVVNRYLSAKARSMI